MPTTALFAGGECNQRRSSSVSQSRRQLCAEERVFPIPPLGIDWLALYFFLSWFSCRRFAFRFLNVLFRRIPGLKFGVTFAIVPRTSPIGFVWRILAFAVGCGLQVRRWLRLVPRGLSIWLQCCSRMQGIVCLGR